MPTSNIVTGQFVRINQTPASMGERMVAQLIDWVVLVAYAYVAFLLVDVLLDQSSRTLRILVFLLFYVFPILFYSLLAELLNHGQSVGKLIMQLRVVKIDGSQPSLGALLMRWLLWLVDGPTMGFLGGVVMLVSRNHQRVGDLAAGTMVIRLGSYKRIEVSLDEFSHLSPDYRPTYPQAEDLSLEQVSLIRQTLDLPADDPRVSTLADKVQATLGLATVRETFAHDFLQRIVRDYQYFALQDV